MSENREVTRLLQQWSDGDREALGQVTEIVHQELVRLAGAYMRRERTDHTLRPTALVNEAYVRLLGLTHYDWKHRGQFFAVAAKLMRDVLVDHARSHSRQKRGSGQAALPLEDVTVFSEERGEDFIAVHEALEELGKFDPRKVEIVDLHFFGGLNWREISEFMGISEATVARELRVAKAWLHGHISKSGSQA